MGAVSIGKIAEVLGVCVMTIRRWHADVSLLPDFITKGGHRRYDTNRVKTIFEPIKDERMTIGYCRVSSSDQISDLETQKLVIEREIASKKNSTIRVIAEQFVGQELAHSSAGFAQAERL